MFRLHTPLVTSVEPREAYQLILIIGQKAKKVNQFRAFLGQNVVIFTTFSEEQGWISVNFGRSVVNFTTFRNILG